MDITYPFARVFTDKTNNLNVFFDESANSNRFEQLKDIGKCVVEFCELDFSECLEELKKLDTKSVSSDFEDIQNRLWYIVDLLKDKHPYVQFFLNSQMVLTFMARIKAKRSRLILLSICFITMPICKTPIELHWKFVCRKKF